MNGSNSTPIHTLDRIESKLPLVPRRIFRLQRRFVDAGFSLGCSVLSALGVSTDRPESSAQTGESTERLEEWTKAELYERAQDLDIGGRSSMSKKELVSALRSV